ncbi:MAG: DUF1499 domain-containing protein [Deltaproteobacteria bacterium]|nr:DUF1499 domain-containing protein [Candidatus Anaeroferrophillus wilburensis]MBN2890176.1 DUF1499 domain-containing protein [Deltaproteobacteria bacterium]
MFRFVAVISVFLFVCSALLACAGSHPAHLGISDSGLAPCPSSPNCVSSDDQDKNHKVLPLQLAAAPADAWQAVRELVLALPRTRIVDETADYLHAECRTLLGFVDDLELHLRPAEGIIAVRSASRLGYSDLGVNRRRVEGLRAALSSRNIVK